LWPDAVFRGADEFVSNARKIMSGMDVTHHIIANHVHDIKGDVSNSRSYVQAQHVVMNHRGDTHHILAGHYDYDFVRVGDDWKIKKLILNVTWGSGNGDLFRLAAERA
jgi:hypothetical protein